MYGQAISHGVASGMGGIWAAGDLVARMQITRGMRLPQAKQYVADKLGVSVMDLSDPVVMLDLRKERGLTLKQMARRTKLSVSLLSQIERAESSASVSSLFKVATALDVRITDLFGGF